MKEYIKPLTIIVICVGIIGLFTGSILPLLVSALIGFSIPIVIGFIDHS